MVRSAATPSCSGSGFRSKFCSVRRRRRKSESRYAQFVIARVTCDEAIQLCPCRSGLLRFARNDVDGSFAMAAVFVRWVGAKLHVIVIHHDLVRGRTRLAGEDKSCLEFPRLPPIIHL